MPSGDNTRRPDPTPAEIRAACREIRKTWSREERAYRAAGMPLGGLPRFLEAAALRAPAYHVIETVDGVLFEPTEPCGDAS